MNYISKNAKYLRYMIILYTYMCIDLLYFDFVIDIALVFSVSEIQCLGWSSFVFLLILFTSRSTRQTVSSYLEHADGLDIAYYFLLDWFLCIDLFREWMWTSRGGSDARIDQLEGRRVVFLRAVYRVSDHTSGV